MVFGTVAGWPSAKKKVYNMKDENGVRVRLVKFTHPLSFHFSLIPDGIPRMVLKSGCLAVCSAVVVIEWRLFGESPTDLDIIPSNPGV